MSQQMLENLKFVTRARIWRCSSVLIFMFLYVSNSTQNASDQFVSNIHLSVVNFTLHASPHKGS
jgi:hypothetical protein